MSNAMHQLYKKLMVDPLKANLDDLADAMNEAEAIWRQHVAAQLLWQPTQPCKCVACRMAEALGMEPPP